MTSPQLPSPLLVCIPASLVTSEKTHSCSSCPLPPCTQMADSWPQRASSSSRGAHGASAPGEQRHVCAKARQGTRGRRVCALGDQPRRERTAARQLPKATGACCPLTSASRSPVTCRASAPSLEGRRVLVIAQSLGPEAWTLDGSLTGPHRARTAQTPRRRPASLHPGKQTARHWPVGFLAFMGGALEWRLPGSARRVVAPQKVPPTEQAWGEVGAGTGVVWDAVRWPAPS